MNSRRNNRAQRVRHSCPSPFPFVTKSGVTIVDEMCRCGHHRSDHSDAHTFAFGHGPCAIAGCWATCGKYTWAANLAGDSTPKKIT